MPGIRKKSACPFCGADVALGVIQSRDGYASDVKVHGLAWQCTVCGAQGPTKQTEDEVWASLVPLAVTKTKEASHEAGTPQT